ncbi:hypothetical protein EMGBS4_12830 [Acidimicrobiaceae bacterium]|nr:hypothetical protein EMGBS4_12830 [Acidimicrobiaceae bacterium]
MLVSDICCRRRVVTAEIIISKRVLKSWWVVVAPTAMWLIWYSQYGVSDIRSDNFSVALRYINESFAGSLSEIFGLSIGWGFILKYYLYQQLSTSLISIK